MSSMRRSIRGGLLAMAGLALLGCGDDVTAPVPAPARGADVVDGRPVPIPNAVKYRDTGHHPATGRAGGASITTRALLGRDGVTDFDVYAGEGSGAGAGVLRKVQLKLFTFGDDHLETRNYVGLSGDRRVFPLPGLSRNTPYQVQANVESAAGERTGVVTVRDVVKLRPDLAVVALDVPSAAWVNAPAFITAVVRERNGDVGARATCVLDVDGAPVDSAVGIWVDAGGTVSCEFAHVFTTAGTHPLRVRLTGAEPGDYDVTNDTATGTIEVTMDVVLAYSANVADRTFWDRRTETSEFYGATTMSGPRFFWARTTVDSTVGRYQVARIDAATRELLPFPEEPLRNVRLTMATNGVTVDETGYDVLASDYVDQTPYGTSGCIRREASTTIVTSLVLCAYRSAATAEMSTELHYQWAPGDVTYHSRGSESQWCTAPITCSTYSFSWNVSRRDARGEFVSFGPDFTIHVEFVSGSRRLVATAVVPLRETQSSGTTPGSCSWTRASREGYIGYLSTCVGSAEASEGVVGSAGGPIY